MEQLKLFVNNLPKKPYCSDYPPGGMIIRSVDTAVRYRHIQPNHPNSKLWLMFDIDRHTGPEELTDVFSLPAPTFWIQNPENSHAHALYALETPVHMNASSSQAAIRFAAAVDVAFSIKMSADPGYSGVLCKNPLHKHWKTYALGGCYDLTELSEYVDLQPFGDRRRNLPDIGLGRNCTLFDRLRYWSYKAIRQGWPEYDRWLLAVEERAGAYNDFTSPLDSREVHHIAKSVARWTFRKFSPQGFDEYIERLIQNTHTPEIQSKRALKSAQTKRNKREKQIIQAIGQLQSDGKKVTKSAVARLVGIDRRVLNKCYSELFQKSGILA